MERAAQPRSAPHFFSPERAATCRRIAVFRALQLGDLLCSVPALRALRLAAPRAEIALIGLPWAEGFVSRFSRYIDRFFAFPGFPGLPERDVRTREVPRFIARMQSQRFDLALQLHGDGRITNPLVALFNARATAGFFSPTGYCPDPALFLPYPEDKPEPERLLTLSRFLGAPAAGRALEFPVLPEDRAALATLPEAEALRPGEYVCVHAGAREHARRWPARHFTAVADALAQQGLTVVLTGAREETSLTRRIARAMHAPCIDLCGRTSLGTLAALLETARLLVCNDTGVSHLAAALGTPSLVVFTASDPRRWAPAARARHRILWRPAARAAAHAALHLIETEVAHAA